MKKQLCLAVLAVTMSGCLNIYERWPTTDTRIEEPYQATLTAGAFTYFAAFPQQLGGAKCFEWHWANIFSIPLFGLPMAVDTCLEAVFDTLLFPVDYLLSERDEN